MMACATGAAELEAAEVSTVDAGGCLYWQWSFDSHHLSTRFPGELVKSQGQAVPNL